MTCSETPYFRTTDETNNQPLGVQWISPSDLTCFISAILAAQTANTWRGNSNIVAAKIPHAASSWTLFARSVPAPSVGRPFHKVYSTHQNTCHQSWPPWHPCEVGSTHLAKLATRMDSIWHCHSLQCVLHGSSLWVDPSIFQCSKGGFAQSGRRTWWTQHWLRVCHTCLQFAQKHTPDDPRFT